MQKVVTGIFLISIVIITVMLVYFSDWVILPTKSFSKMLTVVCCGYTDPERITLRHYVDDVCINNYILEFKVLADDQHAQFYQLPKLSEGRVTVTVEISDDNFFIVNYEEARNLYKNGLLLYTSTDTGSNVTINGLVYYDEYVYFISGKNKISYMKTRDKNWLPVKDTPHINVFQKKEKFYMVDDYKWKENKWDVVPGGDRTDN